MNSIYDEEVKINKSQVHEDEIREQTELLIQIGDLENPKLSEIINDIRTYVIDIRSQAGEIPHITFYFCLETDVEKDHYYNKIYSLVSYIMDLSNQFDQVDVDVIVRNIFHPSMMLFLEAGIPVSITQDVRLIKPDSMTSYIDWVKSMKPHTSTKRIEFNIQDLNEFINNKLIEVI